MTKSKIKWIDLQKDDPHHISRDWYIHGTIRGGADSIEKLMAVTYLSQFYDLNGEFAARPVFRPDFIVGIIPYSSALLDDYNSLVRRGFLDFNGNCQNLVKPREEDSQKEIDALVRSGTQLSHLYLANLENLKQCKTEKDLFEIVKKCVLRDRDIRKNLEYVTDF